MQQHIKDRLAPYKYPRWIEFVPELPKTATGKIQRFKASCIAVSSASQQHDLVDLGPFNGLEFEQWFKF
jgi:acyl-coenzyme A synthetase/AMP-(fatty) acid ligase